MKTFLAALLLLLSLARPAAAQDETRPLQYRVNLRLSEKDAQGNSTTLIQPTLVTLAGHKASFFVGQEIVPPVPLNGLAKLDVGFLCEVTPTRLWGDLVLLNWRLVVNEPPGVPPDFKKLRGSRSTFAKVVVPGKRYQVECKEAGKTYVLDF